MPTRPISRHYNFGVTFRWVQGESHIAVKRGYVCEGSAFVVRYQPRSYKVMDRPKEDPHNDKDTWIATIPASPSSWSDDQYFVKTVHEWAYAHPHLVNLSERTDAR